MDTQAAKAIDAEVQRIEMALRESGFWLMNDDQFRLLLRGADSGLTRFAQLAQEHEWNFEFHPHNGEVRISLLPTRETTKTSDPA